MTSAKQQPAESALRVAHLRTRSACLILPDVATSIRFLPKLVAFFQISTVTYVIHIMHIAAYSPDRLKE